MAAPTPAPPPDDDPVDASDPSDARWDGEPGAVGPRPPDLSGLPIAGITRRRLAFLAGALLSAWIIIVFARQVGESAAATARVDVLRDDNVALVAELGALEREAELIQRQEWVVQQARGYRLGEPGEIPFAVTNAGELPPDAPGSASVRLGGPGQDKTPLESWLSLLFGPSR